MHCKKKIKKRSYKLILLLQVSNLKLIPCCTIKNRLDQIQSNQFVQLSMDYLNL